MDAARLELTIAPIVELPPKAGSHAPIAISLRAMCEILAFAGVAMAAVAFVHLLEKKWTRLSRRGAAMAGTILAFMVGSGSTGLLFMSARIKAQAVHMDNIGIPILYFAVWIALALIAPLLGLGVALAIGRPRGTDA